MGVRRGRLRWEKRAMKRSTMATAMAAMAAVGTAAGELSAVREGKQLVIRHGEREVLRYQAEPGDFPRADIPEIYRRGGYIQSFHTPSGRLVTDDFPPEHVHHHGIWTPWTKTVFEGRTPDFWNMGDGTGRVDFVALDEVLRKDSKVGFRARHRFIDMTAEPEKPVLEETWQVEVAVGEERFVIDFAIKQVCAGGSHLKLPE